MTLAAAAAAAAEAAVVADTMGTGCCKTLLLLPPLFLLLSLSLPQLQLRPRRVPSGGKPGPEKRKKKTGTVPLCRGKGWVLERGGLRVVVVAVMVVVPREGKWGKMKTGSS